jgi:hypothetical protein
MSNKFNNNNEIYIEKNEHNNNHFNKNNNDNENDISIFDKIQFTFFNTVNKIKNHFINEEKVFIPELITTEKLNKKTTYYRKIIVPPVTLPLKLKNNKTFTNKSTILKDEIKIENGNNNDINNIENNKINKNIDNNNNDNNNDNNKDINFNNINNNNDNNNINNNNTIDNNNTINTNNLNNNSDTKPTLPPSSQKFTKYGLNISDNISDTDYLLHPSSPLFNSLEKSINLQFTKSSLTQFYNSLFSLNNFKEFYNHSNLILSIRSEGSLLTSSFPLIKTLYSISKSELKEKTNCDDLMQYMYNINLRKYWDSVIKKFDIIEGNEKNFLVSTWGNSPMFLISERDSIEKRFMFEYEIEGKKKYFLFSMSIEEDFIERKEDVIRIFNPINFLMLFDDEEKFYFYNLTQSDFKMNLPQIIMNVTLPITSLNWYKNLKKFSFEVDKVNGEYIVNKKNDDDD